VHPENTDIVIHAFLLDRQTTDSDALFHPFRACGFCKRYMSSGFTLVSHSTLPPRSSVRWSLDTLKLGSFLF
jgi:hypothetical protein